MKTSVVSRYDILRCDHRASLLSITVALPDLDIHGLERHGVAVMGSHWGNNGLAGGIPA